ncbi:MAG: Holliday junction resolvase RuvX [Pseudomonadota bacterium]|nr:Holliday junction resolvase RuvX [Pseudomonadota bacterium]
MIHDNVQNLKPHLEPGGRLLGLDVGTKTIGIAVSDSALAIASAIKTIRRTKFNSDTKTLREIRHDRGAGGIVIGLPVSMDGTEGPACQSVRQFAANLDVRLETHIAFWDERLSSSAVKRLLIEEADMSRKRRSEVVDKLAATYILQGALGLLHG